MLRRDQVPQQVAASYQSIDGALAVQDDIPLGPTPDFAVPILGRVGAVTAEMVEEDPERYQPGDVAGLSGLEARYDEQLTGTSGVVVDAIASDGKAREVFRVDAIDGESLATTMDLDLQLEAERLLAGVGPAAALVAVRPSTGAVLAAANGPGTGGVNIATYGQAAPGSTFKTVSTLALLRAGLTPGHARGLPDQRGRRRPVVRELRRLPAGRDRPDPAAHRAGQLVQHRLHRGARPARARRTSVRPRPRSAWASTTTSASRRTSARCRRRCRRPRPPPT